MPELTAEQKFRRALQQLAQGRDAMQVARSALRDAKAASQAAQRSEAQASRVFDEATASVNTLNEAYIAAAQVLAREYRA